MFKHLIDNTKPMVLQKIPTEKRPIAANVQLVCNISTSNNNAHPDYSGSVGRCRESWMYVTSAGQLILRRSDYTQWQGELDRNYAYVFSTLDELKKFLDGLSGRAERMLIDELSSIIDLCDTVE
jgi:hypothetical protein